MNFLTRYKRKKTYKMINDLFVKLHTYIHENDIHKIKSFEECTPLEILEHNKHSTTINERFYGMMKKIFTRIGKDEILNEQCRELFEKFTLENRPKSERVRILHLFNGNDTEKDWWFFLGTNQRLEILLHLLQNKNAQDNLDFVNSL